MAEGFAFAGTAYSAGNDINIPARYPLRGAPDL